jgi:hypothetical protein
MYNARITGKSQQNRSEAGHVNSERHLTPLNPTRTPDPVHRFGESRQEQNADPTEPVSVVNGPVHQSNKRYGTLVLSLFCLLPSTFCLSSLPTD